jgi:CheY-like chemotaxis protein
VAVTRLCLLLSGAGVLGTGGFPGLPISNRGPETHECRVCSDRYKLVATGTEALAALALHTFNVVLMDVQMPKVTGFEAGAEKMARAAMYSSLP